MKPGIDYIGVGAGCLIVNEKNEVLLMKRSKNCKNAVGYWTRTGGTIEFMEKIEDAVKREVKEEIGVEIKLTKSLGYSDYIIKSEKQHRIIFGFIGKIVGGEITNMEPHKCEEIKWFSLDNLPKPMTNYTKDSIKEFKKTLKN